ncbi:MAG: hypothetical protein HFACDABA_02175 [Anaerolineales bacterium]|nr:hypothetical protein [Anaerolineales bacterium]
MNKTLYRFVSWGFQELFRGGDVIGQENLPATGPAVFVANHLGALGPIAVGGSLHYFLHPWIHADILDPRRAADYLRRDFIAPQLRVPPPFDRWLARGISKLHVPLLRAIGGIPVYHTRDGLQDTLSQTLELLKLNRFILIFPEDPASSPDPQTAMRPFQKGFTRLGELYYEQTRRPLSFHPLAVHAATRSIRAGKPIRYNCLNHPASERQRIKDMLEKNIRAMILQASHGEAVHLPLPN